MITRARLLNREGMGFIIQEGNWILIHYIGERITCLICYTYFIINTFIEKFTSGIAVFKLLTQFSYHLMYQLIEASTSPSPRATPGHLNI